MVRPQMLWRLAAACLLPCVSAQCWRNTECTAPKQALFPGPWDANIYAPSARTVSPAGVLQWPNLEPSAYSASLELSGNGSLVTLDFGIEVGGILTISWESNAHAQLGLAFTESKKFVGE